MKILVTGIYGFIGSHFAELALDHGHEIVGLDLVTYAARRKNFNHKMIEVYENDICNSVCVNHIFNEHKPDAVVHFAAESHVARSIENREEFLRTNVIGTNVLLEESLKYWRGTEQSFASTTNYLQSKLRTFTFLHVSTDEVYGSLGLDDNSWTEESPYAPNNPYSASKASADCLVRSYNKTYGLPTIITHCANNYGAKQHHEKLIPLLIKQLINDQPLTIHGDGLNVRDWIHVEDHCEGLLLALTYGANGETYNFGGDCERTNIEIASLLADAMGKHLNIVTIPDRAGNDRRYSTNTMKARIELGWAPQAQIESRINNVIKWYLDNPNYGADYGR